MKAGALMLVAVLTAIVVIVGATYEQVEQARDREDLPQIGRSIDIGGRTLNLDCSGSGSPTVIFKTGAPRSGYSWIAIQRHVAEFTRACWYDRAGFGWSELGPYPRTSSASARDLHALLQRAGIRPPYLLVAETFAALDARVYTGMYPADVTGVVLIDALHPDLLSRLPQIRGKAAPVQKYIGYPQNIASQIFSELGLIRLISQRRRSPGPPPPELTAAEWSTILRLSNQPRARVALLQELPAIDASLAEVRAAGNLGDRPLRVISRTPAPSPGDEQRVFQELQADLVRLSTRGKQVLVAPQGAGPLYYQAPQAVVDAVRDVITNLRQIPSTR